MKKIREPLILKKIIIFSRTFSVCSNEAEHPPLEYLQGNMTVEATFSMARFLMLPPSWPRQVGQHVSLGRQLEQTR